jgi:EmrB/QacA subfamily drug resistance transporter
VTRSTPRRTLAVLFCGVLLAALDIAIVGPALPAIGASFGVDSRALSWVFSLYILGNLIGAPLLAKLSDRRGRRAVYVGCLLGFAGGSAVVAAAPNLAILLGGRAIQGLASGGILPVATAVIADTFAVERRGRALGLIGAVFGLAFLLGPMLGGLLLRYAWQWLFLVNIPVVAVVSLASLRILPSIGADRARPFDWSGAATMAVMLAALAWGIGRFDAEAGAGQWLASAPFIAAAFVAGALFWRAEHRAADPIFDPALFRSTQIRAVGAIAAVTGVVEASMVFLPSLSVAAFDVSASTASWMLLPLVAMLIVGAPAAGHLLDRIGPRPVLQIGLAMTATGLFVFAVSPLSVASFYGAGALVGLGLSAVLGAPLRFVALQEGGEHRRGASQGLLALFLGSGRIVGAALIGGIAAGSADELAGFRQALLCVAVLGLVAILASAALKSGRPTASALADGEARR